MEKLLLYCPKAEPNLYMPYEHDCFEDDEASRFYLDKESILPIDIKLNGKIVAMCDCDLVEEVAFTEEECHGLFYQTSSLTENYLLQYACLKRLDLDKYLGWRTVGYALYLSNVEVFDNPKELSDYRKYIDSNYYYEIKQAPQNMMIVYDKDGNRYILLPIKSKYLCKILNGEKTIEIRRKILKELKELIK